MNRNKVNKELLNRYLNNNCTPEEEQLILQWFYSFNSDNRNLDNELMNRRIPKEINKRLELALFSEESKRSFFHLNKKWTSIAAALLILLISITLYNLFLPKTLPNIKQDSADTWANEKCKNSTEILPGKSLAEIIYPNGHVETIRDSSFKNASFLASNQSGNIQIDVPLGAEFKIILEDGTKVWLNSSTKLSYPSSFNNTERTISLVGEAYFEVSEDKHRPFKINANGTEIEVLGTSFNVNAYSKEVRTQLKEGSIKIRKEKLQNILLPGQEAVITNKQIEINEIDIGNSISWHEGKLYFNGGNLHEIMQQISRWYNVEFEIENETPIASSFKGTIDRNSKLASTLKILEIATGKTFELQNRNIIIK